MIPIKKGEGLANRTVFDYESLSQEGIDGEQAHIYTLIDRYYQEGIEIDDIDLFCLKVALDKVIVREHIKRLVEKGVIIKTGKHWYSVEPVREGLLKEPFNNLSREARLIYIHFKAKLDAKILRHDVIAQNHDNYIYYSLDELSNELEVSEETIIQSKYELLKQGIIEEVQQGQGKPNRIYIKKFYKELFRSNML